MDDDEKNIYNRKYEEGDDRRGWNEIHREERRSLQILVSCTSLVSSGRTKLLELRSREFPVLSLLLLIGTMWLGLRG